MLSSHMTREFPWPPHSRYVNTVIDVHFRREDSKGMVIAASPVNRETYLLGLSRLMYGSALSNHYTRLSLALDNACRDQLRCPVCSTVRVPGISGSTRIENQDALATRASGRQRKRMRQSKKVSKYLAKVKRYKGPNFMISKPTEYVATHCWNCGSVTRFPLESKYNGAPKSIVTIDSCPDSLKPTKDKPERIEKTSKKVSQSGLSLSQNGLSLANFLL